MRELEMRMRVSRFLKARVRDTLMPATVGIGLAVGGCAKEGPSAQDSSMPPATDAKLVEVFPVYGVALPPDAASDSAPDGLGRDTPLDGAIEPIPDANVALDQSAAVDAGSIDSGRDLGLITKYGVSIPDASSDTRTIGVLYAALAPADAGADAGSTATRYGAQTPNAS